MKKKTESEKIRYKKRDEIENIVKQNKIDREKFHETSKNNYERIIKNVWYSFCDYEKYPEISVEYMWTKFRNNLHQTEIIRTDWENWDYYINQIDKMILAKKTGDRYYLIVDGGWVYEGELLEIKKVLSCYPDEMEDFYITPKSDKHGLWLIVHCDDGECMFKVY